MGAVREALDARFGDPSVARLSWRPLASIAVDGEQAEQLFRLLEVLEDNDDVQQVSANFEIPDEVMAKLTA